MLGEKTVSTTGCALLTYFLLAAGYMHHISREPLQNTQPHRVLLHYGLGDAQVSWLGAQVLGRSIGAHMYASNVREQNEDLFGFSMIDDRTSLMGNESLIQGWNFGEDKPVLWCMASVPTSVSAGAEPVPAVRGQIVFTASNHSPGALYHNQGAPPVPLDNVPPNELFDAHEKPRRDPRAQLATHLFLTQGLIINACGRDCVFTNGTHDLDGTH